MWKTVQNCPTVSSLVELSFKSDHIARRDSPRQNSFVHSWIGSGDVITLKTQLNKTVLLSRVGRSSSRLNDGQRDTMHITTVHSKTLLLLAYINATTGYL